jgi:hypothetical protein
VEGKSDALHEASTADEVGEQSRGDSWSCGAHVSSQVDGHGKLSSAALERPRHTRHHYARGDLKTISTIDIHTMDCTMLSPNPLAIPAITMDIEI